VAGDGPYDLEVRAGLLEAVLEAAVAFAEVEGARDAGEDGDPLVTVALHGFGVQLARLHAALVVVGAHVSDALAVRAVGVPHDHGNTRVHRLVHCAADGRSEGVDEQAVDVL
jgi:hypothetical protein